MAGCVAISGLVLNSFICCFVSGTGCVASWGWLTRSCIIHRVACNCGSEDVVQAFQRGISESTEFDQLSSQWQFLFNNICYCCFPFSRTWASRIRIARRRVKYGLRLPPWGPPLIAGDNNPGESHTPILNRDETEITHLLEMREFFRTPLIQQVREDIANNVNNSPERVAALREECRGNEEMLHFLEMDLERALSRQCDDRERKAKVKLIAEVKQMTEEAKKKLELAEETQRIMMGLHNVAQGIAAEDGRGGWLNQRGHFTPCSAAPALGGGSTSGDGHGATPAATPAATPRTSTSAHSHLDVPTPRNPGGGVPSPAGGDHPKKEQSRFSRMLARTSSSRQQSGEASSSRQQSGGVMQPPEIQELSRDSQNLLGFQPGTSETPTNRPEVVSGQRQPNESGRASNPALQAASQTPRAGGSQLPAAASGAPREGSSADSTGSGTGGNNSSPQGGNMPRGASSASLSGWLGPHVEYICVGDLQGRPEYPHDTPALIFRKSGAGQSNGPPITTSPPSGRRSNQPPAVPTITEVPDGRSQFKAGHDQPFASPFSNSEPGFTAPSRPTTTQAGSNPLDQTGQSSLGRGSPDQGTRGAGAGPVSQLTKALSGTGPSGGSSAVPQGSSPKAQRLAHPTQPTATPSSETRNGDSPPRPLLSEGTSASSNPIPIGEHLRKDLHVKVPPRTK